MKTSNKQSFFHLLLAFCFMLQFVVTAPVANAAGTTIIDGQITIQFPDSQTAPGDTKFTLYTILTGELDNGVMYYSGLHADLNTYFGGKVTTNPGDATFEADVIAYLEGIESKTTQAEALGKDLASELTGVTGTDRTIERGNTATTFFDLSYGYYLITSESYPAMLVNITGADANNDPQTAVTVTLKSSLPSMTKEIYHNEVGTWGEVGDNQIGDEVNFKITLKLPDSDSVAQYTTTAYQYKLVDVMDNTQFEFTDGSLAVYTQDFSALPTGLEELNEGTHYDFNATDLGTFATGNTGYVIDFDVAEIFNSSFTNFDDMFLYVHFTAKLLDTANVVDNASSEANLNTANLYYSIDADAAWDGTFDPDDIDKLDPKDDTDGNDDTDYETTYDSSGDTVSDYTFKLVGSKLDKSQNPLAGVTFALYEDTTGTAIFLEKSTTLTDTYYPLADNAGHSTSTGAGCIVTGDTGLFTIIGLDDATKYILVEESAPSDDYKLMDDIAFEMTTNDYSGQLFQPSLTVADHAGTQLDYSNNDLVAFDVETGGYYLETEIVNLKNTLLPETGGMGTVLFQVVGAGMMAGAAVLLYLKRKNA